MVAVQQLLCYRSSKKALHVPEPFIKNFRKGSSPADWTTTPDKSQVVDKLLTTAEALKQDYANGLFDDLPDFPIAYNMPFGIQVKNFRQAVIFNNTHEAMHLAIMKTFWKNINAGAMV